MYHSSYIKITKIFEDEGDEINHLSEEELKYEFSVCGISNLKRD